MKKLALAGILIFLAMLFVTCDVPEFEEDIEYTDVVYSADGSTVTLYLDGVGVPVTKAQRALNKTLAMMGYDYLEAVFTYGDSGVGATTAGAGVTVARAAWEIGQTAGISGVYRTSGAGVSYADFNHTAAATAGSAVIFVGKKSDKTLLGIGNLTHVDDQAGSSITSLTRSVTFTVTALQTNIGLIAPATVLTTQNSFVTNAGGTTSGSPAVISATPAFGITPVQFNALGGTVYPIFTLPDPTAVAATNPNGGFSGVIKATFTISGSTLGTAHPQFSAVLQRVNIMFTKRFPRYIERGQNRDINQLIDTKTLFRVTSHLGLTGTPATPVRLGGTNSNVIEMEFETSPTSTGVFAILFRLPVIALTQTPSTNGAEDATWWNIRPGFGGQLYNLDSGEGAGGAILLSIGQTALDWIDIKLADPTPGEIFEM